MLMSQVTTLQIGGPAKDFQVAKTESELIKIIMANQDFLVIGGGSNLLVSDEGVNKLIIKNEIVGTEQNGNKVIVSAGTILQSLVDYTIQRNLSGLQKLTGIPGTVGGALFGNAGAYGQTISDHLIEVKAFDGEKIIILTKEQCQFGYRDSGFKRNRQTILEVTFLLEEGKSQILAQEASDILSKRLIKYPKGIKCPGSFFKNLVAAEIPADILKTIPQELIVYGKLPAGTLLEKIGAKGQTLDGIEIATYHANLFINNGGGTAKAFHDLAKKYAKKVKGKFGITLEPEVQLINLPPLQ